MSTVEDLLTDGILGRVESIAAMRGEEVCIIVDPEPFDGNAFINDESIGGFDELYSLDKQGGLNELLSSAINQ